MKITAGKLEFVRVEFGAGSMLDATEFAGHNGIRVSLMEPDGSVQFIGLSWSDLDALNVAAGIVRQGRLDDNAENEDDDEGDDEEAEPEPEPSPAGGATLEVDLLEEATNAR